MHVHSCCFLCLNLLLFAVLVAIVVADINGKTSYISTISQKNRGL